MIPDTAAKLRTLLGVGRRELLTIEDVMKDYCFPSTEAARQWVRRHIDYEKRGRRILVDRRVIDAKLRERKAS